MENIGKRIREFRILRKLTVRKLAEAANLSASMISQLENQHHGASLSTLTRLAEVLGVSLAELMSEQPVETVSRVLRSADHSVIDWGTGSYKKCIVRRPFTHVEAYELMLEAGDELTDVTYGDSIVLFYAISGTGELTVDDKTEIVNAGDSATFWSSQPHGFRALGDEPLRALLTLTPPAVQSSTRKKKTQGNKND